MTRRVVHRSARLLLAVVAFGVAAGCSGHHHTSTPARSTTTTAARGSSSTSTLAADSDTSPSGNSTTTTGGGTPKKVATGDGLNLATPQGWSWQAYGSAGSGCVGPSHPDDRPCPGVEVRRGAALATATEGGPYKPDAAYGWHTGTDVPLCLDGSGSATTASAVISKQTKSVDGQAADFRAWRVTCADGYTAIVERWNVTSKGVLFTNYANEVGDDVIASATFP